MTVREPPYGEKLKKYFRILVLIAQIKRFGTLNATQKIASLYKAPLLKKSRKTAGNRPLLPKNAFLTIIRQFLGSLENFAIYMSKKGNIKNIFKKKMV